MCRCSSYWSDMSGCARLMISGIWCCIVCMGPLLMSIGIVFLVLDNQREKDVHEYNTAIARYAVKDARILASTTMNVSGLLMTPSLVDVTVVGDRSGVDPTSHYVFTRGGVPYSLTGTYILTLYVDELPPQALLFNVPTQQTVTETIRCNPSLCTSRCSSSDYFCGVTRVRAFCEAELEGTYNGEACNANEVCGSCHFTGTLSRACFVVEFTESGQASASQQTCYHPFGSQQYRPHATSAVVEVMSADDPYLTLQRITEGSADFGITKTTQRNVGICVLVLGIAIMLLFAGLAAFFMRRQMLKIDQRKDMLERTPYPAYPAPVPLASQTPLIPYSTSNSYYDVSMQQSVTVPGQVLGPSPYKYSAASVSIPAQPRDSLV